MKAIFSLALASILTSNPLAVLAQELTYSIYAKNLSGADAVLVYHNTPPFHLHPLEEVFLAEQMGAQGRALHKIAFYPGPNSEPICILSLLLKPGPSQNDLQNLTNFFQTNTLTWNQGNSNICDAIVEHEPEITSNGVKITARYKGEQPSPQLTKFQAGKSFSSGL